MGQYNLNEYQSITFNGIYRKGNELLAFCKQQIEETELEQWEKDVYAFILEWLSPDAEIEANTSGSTGTPKKIKLKKQHMLASALKTNLFFSLDNTKNALLCLSAQYIAGKMMIVRAIAGGFNLLLSKPEGNPVKELDQAVDFTAMVPMQVYNGLGYFKDKIKTVIVGGGAVSEELRQQLLKEKCKFFETYGMTEAVSHIAIRSVLEERTAFKPMPGVRLSLDKRDCLVIEAPEVCDTKIVTNDIVDLKENQEFFFQGRYDNIINSGGIKIIPEKIEKEIAKLIPFDFYISAVPDKKLGQKLVLVLTQNELEKEVLLRRIQEFSGLKPYEKPKDIVFTKVFPYTSNGKINRFELLVLIDE